MTQRRMASRAASMSDMLFESAARWSAWYRFASRRVWTTLVIAIFCCDGFMSYKHVSHVDSRKHAAPAVRGGYVHMGHGGRSEPPRGGGGGGGRLFSCGGGERPG